MTVWKLGVIFGKRLLAKAGGMASLNKYCRMFSVWVVVLSNGMKNRYVT